MSKVHCFTSASFAYLDRVRVLGETLKRHHPDWTFSLCLSDREPENFIFDEGNEPIDNVVRIEELGIPNLMSWIFEHNVVELCTAVKGQMLVRLLQTGAERIIYLDPDIAVFSSLDEIVRILDVSDIILTPHQLVPDYEKSAIFDNEIGSLKYGIYNLGFFAIANRSEGRRFAEWWKARLFEFCFDDLPNGLFTDQRWCDHVPSFFNDVHILRDPGYNVASWNLSQRPVTIELDGRILVAGKELRFFHFTKVTWVGEVMLEKYCCGKIEIFELMHWYRLLLKRHALAGLPSRWWAFDKFDSGRPITAEHRSIYRKRDDLKARFSQPFAFGANTFEEYLISEGIAS